MLLSFSCTRLFIFDGMMLTSILILISGGKKVIFCGLIQYLNLFGVAIGYTIAASVSMM